MTMRTSLFVAVLACVLAAGLLVPGASAQAVTNGDIAFASARGGEIFEIWTVETDGTTPRRMIAGPPGSIEVDPSFDPTGTRVVFARKTADDETYDLMVGNASPPVNAVKLTDDFGNASNDRQGAWSAGGEVAFTRSVRADDTTNIYKISAAGGSPVRLTSTPAPRYDASPAWNATGSQIAFVSDRTGFPQIYTMNADGTGQVAVTAETTCFVANPAWSPDGTELAFEKLCPGSPTGSDLFTMDVISRVQTPLVAVAGHDHQPAYSPDGTPTETQIVFTRIEADGDKDLYTVPLGSGSAAPIAGNAPQADMAPSWAAGPPGPRETAAAMAAPDDQTPSAVGARVRPGKKKPGKGKPKTPRTITKGVRFREMRRQGSDVYVLKVSPAMKPRLDVTLSNDVLPGHERTSRMAKRHRAVAAINGDFGTPSGRPSHTFAEDGDLKQVSFAVAPTFASTQDEQQTTIARPTESVLALEHDDWPVDRWNFGQPGYMDVAAYTGAGGSLELPPVNSCSARLTPSSGRRWGPNLQGVETDFTVAAVACSPAPMAVNGGVVLAARPGSDAAILIGSLTAGERVTLRWSVGFPGVLDTVGGLPLLVENGGVVATQCSESICKRHPRTGIGVTATGRILMVVVDGRRKGSKGMTMVQFAGLMRELHATFALNLDGGGSSTMWADPKGRKLKGRILNNPSDGSERKVSSAVLVIVGKDPGESIGAPIGKVPAGPAPPPAPDQAGERAVLDPASTGGLLEAMAEGTFGPPVDLPRPLRRALREFRSSREPAPPG
jgi:Tol biopolymer transport system component